MIRAPPFHRDKKSQLFGYIASRVNHSDMVKKGGGGSGQLHREGGQLHRSGGRKEGREEGREGGREDPPSVVGTLCLLQWRMFFGLATFSTNFCPNLARLKVVYPPL